jgi:hypothetical protein
MANDVRDTAKERFWRDALRRFAASGLSVRTFCRRERLAEASFYAWRRTIAERERQATRPARANPPSAKPESTAKRPAFLPMVVNDSTRQDGAISIELAGGRVLRLPETIAAARLAEIIAALEATPRPATALTATGATQVQR